MKDNRLPDDAASAEAPAAAQRTAEESAPPATTPVAPVKKSSRKWLMLSLPLLMALGGGYVWLSSGRYEETENANLHRARILISADLAGRVAESEVADNATVEAGELLFRLDPAPWRIALQQADAAVAAARVQVEQLKAAYAAALTQRDLAQSDLAYYQSETDRQTTLTDRGVGTGSQLDDSRHDLDQARQAVASAEVGVQSAASALGGDPEIEVDKHPLVQEAIAAREKAAYTLGQVDVRAPTDGIIAQSSSFKAGQFVTAGTPLFSLMSTESAWVDANFKETQLEGLAPGQSAEVVFDAYPGLTYHATLAAVGAGTGAEFSLLPAQNATGNWVKVTQRVPVRLTLDPGQDLTVLQSGLSATVTVDTQRETGIDRLRGKAEATGILGGESDPK